MPFLATRPYKGTRGQEGICLGAAALHDTQPSVRISFNNSALLKGIAPGVGVFHKVAMPSTSARSGAPGIHSRTHWSLVRRLKTGGDEQAWRDFYAEYGPLLHSLALKCGLSREEAEEAVQDTVTSVFKSLPGFRADPTAGSFKNWLFRLARWRINNQFSKRPRYAGAQAEPFPGGDDTGTGTDPVERIPDASADALEGLWEREWQENALEIALARLKKRAAPRHFQAFYLHVVKGQPPAQVARALGSTVAQIYLVKCRLLPVFKRIIRSLERQPQP